MKNLVRLLGLMIFAGHLTVYSHAQWVQTNGPRSEWISCFGESGDSIFLGTMRNGVFLTTDNGENWVHLDNELPGPTCFVKSGQDLYFGTSGGRVYRSTNKGITWTAMNAGISHIQDLAVNGNTFFASTYSGVCFSQDNGVNWTAINDLNHLNGGPLAVSTNGDGNVKIYAGDYEGLFVSTNNGTSWVQVTNPVSYTNLNITALEVITNNTGGQDLLVGTWGDGVLRYNGVSWSWCNTGLAGKYVHDFVVSGSNIFVGTAANYDKGGVYLSTNNGTSWAEVNAGLLCKDVNALVVNSMNLFAGTTAGGVFRSFNNGASWTQANSGLSYQYANTLLRKGNNMYAGTGNGGVYFSINSGDSWSQINDNTNVFPITAMNIADNQNLFAGTSQGLYRSTESGTNWAKIDDINGVSTGMYSNESIWSIISSPNGTNNSNIFVGTLNNGIKLSTNNGDLWDMCNTGLWSDPRNYIVYALASYSNTSGGTNLYAGMGHQGLSSYGAVYLSTNDGKNWTDISNGLPSKNIWSLAISGNNLFAGTSGSGIYRSNINGTGWTAVNDGLTSQVVSAIAATDKDIFAGTYVGGVFRSSNNGNSWSPFNENLTSLSINALAVDDKFLYAGTVGGGVWKHPLPVVTAIEQAENEIPAQLILLENYPNPFNNYTTIEFYLPKADHVTLDIYNNWGQKVAQLISQEMSSGKHTVEWNASGFTRGIYFCNLASGSFVGRKKLVFGL